jgi:hypothetical protein
LPSTKLDTLRARANNMGALQFQMQ